jgi:hypothetical protein
MTFATLVVARVTYDAIQIDIGGTSSWARRDQAQSQYEAEVVGPHNKRHDEAMAVATRSRENHIERKIVRGAATDSQASILRANLETQAQRLFPDPVKTAPESFETWWARRKASRRSWLAEFVTSKESKNLPLDDNLDWKWGYPISAALGLLNDLQELGWSLRHVSEDHGLYVGADAAEEAYLTRVRYLLSQ